MVAGFQLIVASFGYMVFGGNRLSLGRKEVGWDVERLTRLRRVKSRLRRINLERKRDRILADNEEATTVEN